MDRHRKGLNVSKRRDTYHRTAWKDIERVDKAFLVDGSIGIGKV